MYTAVSIPGETGPVTSASLGSAIEDGGRDRGCQLRHPASKCRTATERLSVCGTGRHQSCDRLAPIRNCDFVSLSDQWSAASSAPTTSARCQGKNVGATATRAMLPILKEFCARKSMHGSTSATRELRVIGNLLERRRRRHDWDDNVVGSIHVYDTARPRSRSARL